MCGIAGIFNIKIQSRELRNKALRMARKIRHRGPDWSGMYCGGSAILAHERLSIVDPQSGGQPLYSSDRRQVLAVNGEIYNHRDIRAQYAGAYEFRTGSDCEVILALYRDKGIHFLEELNGIFAFALYDEEKDEYPDCPRPHRCNTFIYRKGRRRTCLLRQRTQSARRVLRRVRTLLTRTLLSQQGKDDETLVHP